MRKTREARAKARLVEDAAPVFAALGDPLRLRLVRRLAEEGPLSITRLTEGTDVTRQAITKHLHSLESVGLVVMSKAGRETSWELRPVRFDHARAYLDLVSSRWDDALAALKDLVETE